MVESLKDKIPDILNQYNNLSDYLHGDFTSHYLARRATFFLAMKGEISLRIKENIRLLKHLRAVLIEDLILIQEITRPLVERLEYENK